MNKYNLVYESNGKKVELRDITIEQAKEFIENLPKEKENSLQLKKNKNEGEER